MNHSYDYREGAPVSEMAIVDTFTKLIFGEENDFSSREMMIIQAFRNVDANVILDSHSEMGEYLRNLGVREMIHLVARMRELIQLEAEAAVVADAATGSAGSADQSARVGRLH